MQTLDELYLLYSISKRIIPDANKQRVQIINDHVKLYVPETITPWYKRLIRSALTNDFVHFISFVADLGLEQSHFMRRTLEWCDVEELRREIGIREIIRDFEERMVKEELCLKK